MHILFVTHAYPRWDGDVAGAFIERLAVALGERGHAVSVVAPSDAGKGGHDARHGIPVNRVRYAAPRRETLAYRGTMVDAVGSLGGKLAAGRLMFAMARAVRRAARAGRVDLVHAHWWVPGGVSAWLASMDRGPAYVVTLHGTDVAVLERSGIARALARRVLQGAAAVTAVSSFLAERAAAVAGLDAEAMLVQPMPADLVRLSRPSAGGGGVITVGRLVAQKRVDLLLEAVARLKEQGKAVPLTVVGDGPLRGALEEHAERLGITATTRFVGEVKPQDLARAIGDADVFAFPAVGEGLGLAAAEALILGIPVVATRSGGGVTDIVPTEGAGRLVDAGDAGAMAHAIGELLDNPAARSLATSLGAALRERFDPQRVAQRFDSLYDRLVYA
ncbi:MAG: glycosyltransferase [Gemmatimonadota bacterium]|nr:MAG: glycosyltransferase [Gemmatimonadota bacterium]